MKTSPRGSLNPEIQQTASVLIGALKNNKLAKKEVALS